MEFLSDLPQLASQPGDIVLAIGTFDGLHLGHQRVIQQAVHAAAARTAARSGILTFSSHPLQLIAPDRAPAPLSTPAQRARAFADQGAHFCLTLDFTPAFAAQSAEAFAESLIRAAPRLRQIVVGSDWRFGKDRQGDVHLLARIGAHHAFTVASIDTVTVGGIPVKSTRIREAAARGELALCHRLLGRPYAVEGTIARGSGLGHQLGYPTANIEWDNPIIPPPGVYAAYAQLDSWPAWQRAAALVNLGFRPTLRGPPPSRPILEAHLLDAEGDWYGHRIEIQFLAFLRGERRFPDLAALRRQIDADRTAALAAIAAGTAIDRRAPRA